MDTRGQHRRRRYDAAAAVVAFLGLYQGAVPLVVRGVFDGDQSLAPALHLPSPWWWITCLAIVVVAVASLVAIHAAGERHAAPQAAPSSASDDASPATDDARDEREHWYDTASALVLLVGVYNGLVALDAARQRGRGSA